ncbi:MAG: glycosyltransferase, partial [Candidatus Aenigmarchaeota archaeon]|nr:glycosyltransferase [Candidatus Aenigmarchaeota archaeon]
KNFICYIVGDGQSLPVLKKTASELNLENFVEFKGYIYDREKIREYLDLADVCVEPAPDNDLNRHSTFIKVMEYMASTKPIVAFDLKE